MKSIHFIVEAPFEKRDFERFGIIKLSNQGFKVFVWDISPLCSKMRFKNAELKNQIFYFEGYYAFKNKYQAIKKLRSFTPDDVVLFLVGYRLENIPFFISISQSQAVFGSMILGNIPILNLQDKESIVLKKFNLFNKIIRSLKNPRYVLNRFFLHTKPKKLLIRDYDFLLVGGERFGAPPLLSKITKIIKAHSLDYENYFNFQSLRSGKERNFNKYIVYLDEYTPFHPDYNHLGQKPPTTPEVFYPRLCEFFDFIEKQTRKKIIICAHPRSEYEKHPDYFNSRVVIKGKTIELVKNSSFVLAQSSTSLSYAVIFEKPVIFLSLRSFTPHEINLNKSMSYSFGKKPIFIDKDYKSTFNLDDELKINKNAYKNYLRNYLKSPKSKKESVWKIFGDHI